MSPSFSYTKTYPKTNRIRKGTSGPYLGKIFFLKIGKIFLVGTNSKEKKRFSKYSSEPQIFSGKTVKGNEIIVTHRQNRKIKME